MKAIKSSPRGRKCKFPQCRHILSIYNHDVYCNVHRRMISSGKDSKIRKLA